jgi:predicted ATPase/transcriptional regulator with XRE-family HTH domain
MPPSRTPAITPEQFTSFGELLKYLRHRAGYTQRELSIAVGYSESQISRLEQDQRAPDEASLAARFVPALHLETEPAWAARLLKLGAASRAAPEPDRPIPVPEASSPLNNLPLALTSFIGRERELAEVKRLLTSTQSMTGERVGLLTLTGPGGTGKTRLALQAAAGLLSWFPDGVWLTELAPLTDPALVPQMVAAVLGVPEEANRSLLATLTDHLRDKKMLLVLDNCEHLVAASAEFAEAVLRASPDLRILASSRENLGVSGERAFYVPSLTAPEPAAGLTAETALKYEAVRLFVERAAVAAPGFAATDKNAAAIAQICKRLDGIPLAIELAAVRLRALPVEQLAARLDDLFRLLTGGNRTALPRHQTLTALIDWSYDPLPEAERIFLRRLSVFAGGWTLEAAEAVGAGPGMAATDVFDLLARLIDKSLALMDAPVPGRGVRYRLLETIRQYALAKLAASGEADDVRRRHAEYYLVLVKTDYPSSRFASPLSSWFERLDREQDNLRAAIGWSRNASDGTALSLELTLMVGRFWITRGYLQEYIAWLKAALELAEQGDYPQFRAELTKRVGQGMLILGDAVGGRALLSNSVRLFEELGDIPGSADALSVLGTLLYGVGDFENAQVYMKESLGRLRAVGDAAGIAESLRNLGWLARERGDASTADAYMQESLALSRGLGDEAAVAFRLVDLAGNAILQEDSTLASLLLEQALSAGSEQDSTLYVLTLNFLGNVAQLEGDFVKASELHQRSLALSLPLDWKYIIACDHLGLGMAALAQSETHRAAQQLMSALSTFRAANLLAGVAWCLAGLAGVAAQFGDAERAARVWGSAEKLREVLGVRMAPAARPTQERLMAQAREQLGETAFAEAWAEGQKASMEQAIAAARQVYR